MTRFSLLKLYLKIEGEIINKKGLIIGVFVFFVLLYAGFFVYSLVKPSENDAIHITGEQIETYKMSREYFDFYENISDEEIIDKILKGQIIYNLSVEAGNIVTQEEIDSFADSQKETMKQIEEAINRGEVDEQSILSYENQLKYFEYLGMTFDEFFDFAKPTYEQLLYRGKLMEQLRAELSETNEYNDSQELEAAVKERLDKLVDDELKKIGDVVIDD